MITPAGMFHYMPPIYWHDRQSLLSVDVNRVPLKDSPMPVYKIVTSSVQKEVRIWSFTFDGTSEEYRIGKAPLVVNFLSNIIGHMTTVNVVRFSPSGEFIASGDVDGTVMVWKIGNPEASPTKLHVDNELPPNKEFWIRSRPPFRHDSDVTDIAWNADSTLICVASNDDSLNLYSVVTGKRLWRVSSFRHFPNGVTWDPLQKYIITMSTDRKMDILNAKDGARLKCFSQLYLASNIVNGNELPPESYRMFHDDTLGSFSRRADFSPGGEFLFAPCGHLEAGATSVYGLYVFKRNELNSDRPFALIPTRKAPFLVRSCPKTFELLPGKDNFLGLAYRVLWAAITKDSLYIFDSQHNHPIAYVENLHYNNLSDLSWSHDGQVLIISSLEGFNSFVQVNLDTIGIIDTCEHPRPASPEPALIQPKKKRKTNVEATPTSVSESKTPLKDGNSPAASGGTPKSTKSKSTAGPLLKFLKRSDNVEGGEQEAANSSNPTTDAETTPKVVKKTKKRVQVVTIEE